MEEMCCCLAVKHSVILKDDDILNEVECSAGLFASCFAVYLSQWEVLAILTLLSALAAFLFELIRLVEHYIS